MVTDRGPAAGCLCRVLKVPFGDTPSGAERYLAKKLGDSKYKAAFDQAKERIDQIDLVIRALDERCAELNLTTADLAPLAGVESEAIRRLFSSESSNATLSTSKIRIRKRREKEPPSIQVFYRPGSGATAS